MSGRLIGLVTPLSLAALFGCASTGVRRVGTAGGYSISYIDATPKPGATLDAGQTVAFSVTVEYRLDVADSGRIVLVFEDQDDRMLLPGRTQVTQVVLRGSGRVTLSDILTLPQGVRRVRLFVPLVPKGLSRTSGEVVIGYPVRTSQ